MATPGDEPGIHKQTGTTKTPIKSHKNTKMIDKFALGNSYALTPSLLVITLQGRCHYSPYCTEGGKI